jgi:hypothetical protein
MSDYHCQIDALGETRKSFVVPWPCDDVEIEALLIIRQVLANVPNDGRLRVLDYFRDKHSAEALAQ